MRGQYEELVCPFCDKGIISCLYFPGSVKSVKSGGRGIRSVSKSSDEWIIQSDCPKCGKSADEIEKELKGRNMI